MAKNRSSKSQARAPFLKRLTMLPEKAERDRFPFDSLPFLQAGDFELELTTPITFLVGENGTGKSTLLEAIASLCGFPADGGSQDYLYETASDGAGALAAALRPSWLPRVSEGFFFRSESFFNVASYIDGTAKLDYYGDRRMHEQSHGESFLALFTHKLHEGRRAVYLMDEPETALSPMRQLSFLALLRDWEASGRVQAIVATHSPIILSYPGARLLSFDGDRIEETTVEETDHFRVTRAFLGNPARYLREIFGKGE